MVATRGSYRPGGARLLSSLCLDPCQGHGLARLRGYVYRALLPSVVALRPQTDFTANSKASRIEDRSMEGGFTCNAARTLNLWCVRL
jgi:hypothetical protein